MAQALRLAEQGLYTTHPNPRVGAVVVQDGEIVGQGFHLQAGGPHAEAAALAQAGERAKDATVYCTLEPCSYRGRTPACARALIDAGVARVVVAMPDPHPKNSGAGLAMLAEAGIEVETGLMSASAHALNPGHVKRFETGLPLVRLKLGMSMDGRTALANGVSQWITGPEARRDVQRLRARSSAIVTGVQTVIDDDPRLDVRPAELGGQHAELASTIGRPLVVLDPRQRIDRKARVLSNPNVLIVSAEESDDLPGFAAPTDEKGRIALEPLLRRLADREVNEVLFECGPTLAGAVVAAGLVDELVLYAAPVMLGPDGRGLLQLAKIDSMQHRIEWDLIESRRIGDDLKLVLKPRKRGA